MYRCMTCRKRTEDIDVAPCNPANHPYKPEFIRTMHRYVYNRQEGTVTLLCTGNPPTPGTTGVGGNYGVTCIRCKEKMRPSSFQGNGVPGAKLAQTENPDTLSAEKDNPTSPT